MENIVFQYPSWYLLLCGLLGLIFALGLYYRTEKFADKKASFKWLLGFLRFISVTTIAILLLSPLLKSIIQNQKDPIIIIAEDASESIGQELKEEALSAYRTELGQLETKLGEKFDIRRLNFGTEVREGAADSFDYKVTNLSKTLKYISDNYGDQNIGAIFLATDGIYNEGINPLYLNTEIKAPLYPIALGDTTKQKDLYLKNVFHNKIVYLQDEFIMQVDIKAQNCSAQTTRLEVFELQGSNKTKVHTEIVKLNGNDFFTTKEVKLKAKKSGIIKYRLRLTSVSGESNTSNNSKTVLLEVLDARQKIMILANAPHPDIHAYKTLILNNKNYTVDLKYAGRDQPNLSGYDLVILHDLPSNKNALDNYMPTLNRLKIPRIFVVGSQTNLPAFNQLQSAMTINTANTSSNEIQAIFKDGFSSFTIDPEIKKAIQSFPPILSPYGEYKEGAKSNTLLYQKIGKVDTEFPLISFSDLNNTKTGVIAAEGIWKWKLFNYLEYQNHEILSDFINRIVQFTTVKDDKRKFRVDAVKNIFKENESIKIDAQLFNDSYESINTPDAFVTIKNESGKEFNYTFSKVDNYYTIEPGLLPEGNYRFSAKVNSNGKELTDKGTFSVRSIELEQYDLTARHDILHNLASKNGGKLFYPNQINDLAESIMSNDNIKPVIYNSTKTQSILNLKWLLGLLLLSLAGEWFLRRYHGSY